MEKMSGLENFGGEIIHNHYSQLENLTDKGEKLKDLLQFITIDRQNQ